jgi:AcrR family transcriptional regulator
MSETVGRPNQRRRTRKDLLQAAARLMKQGRAPSLEEVAEEAMVSRATAYRYFPNVETLLIEAPLDLAIPTADEVLGDAAAEDAVARVERVDSAFDEMMRANESALRMMLAQSVQRPLREAEEGGDLPVRQNRRSTLIEAALKPAAKDFKRGEAETLAKALALVIGAEAMIVFKDVLQVDRAEARKVRRWMIKALVDAAKK